MTGSITNTVNWHTIIERHPPACHDHNTCGIPTDQHTDLTNAGNLFVHHQTIQVFVHGETQGKIYFTAVAIDDREKQRAQLSAGFLDHIYSCDLGNYIRGSISRIFLEKIVYPSLKEALGENFTVALLPTISSYLPFTGEIALIAARFFSLMIYQHEKLKGQLHTTNTIHRPYDVEEAGVIFEDCFHGAIHVIPSSHKIYDGAIRAIPSSNEAAEVARAVDMARFDDKINKWIKEKDETQVRQLPTPQEAAVLEPLIAELLAPLQTAVNTQENQALLDQDKNCWKQFWDSVVSVFEKTGLYFECFFKTIFQGAKVLFMFCFQPVLMLFYALYLWCTGRLP